MTSIKMKTMRRDRNPGTLFLLALLTCASLPQLTHCQQDIYHDNTTLCANTSINASIEYSQCLDDIPFYDSCPDPTLCEAADGDNVALAFGLTIGAGLATTLGALLPYIPFIKRSNTTFLAVGLALAAGVMLYVSFTEILKKSKDNFCCRTPDHYEVAATGCFFAGILLTVLLDLLVGLLQKLDCGCTCGCSSPCTSRCTRNRALDDQEETRHSRLRTSTKEKAPRQTKSGKYQMNAVNGVHKEFDITHQYTEGGLTPIMSSSEAVSPTSSTLTAESLEEGEEPGMVAVETQNSTTESAEEPVPNCDGRRALIINDADSTSNNTGATPLTRPSSVSDTESRCYAAITPDGVSTTLSENTNNYANASVNELFSTSSLLRMNAVIPPETVSVSAVSATGEDVGVVGIMDSKSHVSVMVEECSGIGGDVGGVAERKKTPHILLRRHSYSEMVEQKHDDIHEPMGPEEFKEVAMVMGKDARKLHRMGILTGLAIGIHNFPEGLATFVAALSSPSLGIALAIAIALHNIPEGVCVAMPVYYATGKKWKGFLWAFLSGISEPFGALLGWLVFKDIFGPLVYGCLFGLIAGMMVFISLKELLPTALKFDKRGLLVSAFIVVGMVVMAASLLLFLY